MRSSWNCVFPSCLAEGSHTYLPSYVCNVAASQVLLTQAYWHSLWLSAALFSWAISYLPLTPAQWASSSSHHTWNNCKAQDKTSFKEKWQFAVSKLIISKVYPQRWRKHSLSKKWQSSKFKFSIQPINSCPQLLSSFVLFKCTATSHLWSEDSVTVHTPSRTGHSLHWIS